MATATFPVEVAAGKRVRYSGYIKTQGITRGWAGLWWRVDGKSGVLAFDNMHDRGATGTTDWKRYENGGAVITKAAVGASNVRAMVYVAAFAPDAGENLQALLEKYPSRIGGALVPDGGKISIHRQIEV